MARLIVRQRAARMRSMSGMLPQVYNAGLSMPGNSEAGLGPHPAQQQHREASAACFARRSAGCAPAGSCPALSISDDVVEAPAHPTLEPALGSFAVFAAAGHPDPGYPPI